jgi:hypothetical protein
MQLMQALAQGQEPQGTNGAGGAGDKGGAGKAQGLLQEFAQLLQLLSQLSGGGNDRPQCKHSAQQLADNLGGGGNTLDQIDEPKKGSYAGGGTGDVGGPDHTSGSDSRPNHDVSPGKPTGGSGANGTKPSDKPDTDNKVDTDTKPSTGGSTPSSKVDGPPPMNGEKIVNQTIVVKAGETFDGKGMHFKAGPALGDGGQGESQKPVFELEPGAKLKNVQLSGADGVHAKGDATLDNVWWRDVGEDAFTMKGEGKVTINGGGAFNASDKIFQLNHGGSFTLNNFTADTFGKAIRTNGGKDFPIDINVNNSTFRNGEEAVVRSDATQAKIKLSGNTIEDTKFDVIAPKAAQVEGAHQRG